MASAWNAKKRALHQEAEEATEHATRESLKRTHDTVYFDDDKLFKSWKFGSVNIRSGKEKDECAKLYAVAKEISSANLAFCCLQEVKYRNSGKKLIRLDNGERYEFHWCGNKKRRKAGVGMIIKVDENIEIKDPDVAEPRLMALNLVVYGFNVRVINLYSPTNTDGVNTRKMCSTEH